MTTPLHKKVRIYLDHAAATPLDADVFRALEPYLTHHFGNASAIHEEGKNARMAVEAARAQVAKTLAIRPEEIIFSGSGTESNNLAIMGHLRHLKETGRTYETMEVLTTEIEHPSILALLPELTTLGVTVKMVGVDSTGKIQSAELRTLLSSRTVLITFAYVNSEIGVIQPVHALVRIIRQYERENGSRVFIHLDAAQAPLWLSCKLEALGVDALALDSGKFCGPKGVGIVAIRKPKELRSIVFGGGQEGGVRPGTENVAGVVGAALALELAQERYEARAEATTLVRDAAILKLRAAFPGLLLNGPEGASRVANNINVSLPNLDTEYAVVFLDAEGIAASTKSACAGGGSGVSHVVLAATGDEVRAKATLRFTLGEHTTPSELESVVSALQLFTITMQALTKE